MFQLILYAVTNVRQNRDRHGRVIRACVYRDRSSTCSSCGTSWGLGNVSSGEGLSDAEHAKMHQLIP